MEMEPPSPQHQNRQRIFNVPPIVVRLIVVVAVAHLLFLLLSPGARDEALWLLALVPAREVGFWETNSGLYQGALLWTPVTSMFLHGSWTHLALNLVWLLAFGSPVARWLGGTRFVFFYLLCGLAGSLVYVAFNPESPIPVIGASGAISGLMGGVIGMLFTRRLRPGQGTADTLALSASSLLLFIIIWFAINFFFGWTGLTPSGQRVSIAWEAHMGGFFAGLLTIHLFAGRR